MKFLPMETAPRNGVPVMLQCPNRRCGGWGWGTDAYIGHNEEDQPTGWALIPEEDVEVPNG